MVAAVSAEEDSCQTQLEFTEQLGVSRFPVGRRVNGDPFHQYGRKVGTARIERKTVRETTVRERNAVPEAFYASNLDRV